VKSRDIYLTQLIHFRDKPLIKVITGIRRCGKSTLLSLFAEHLLQSGIDADHIIRMNFESFDFAELTDFKDMHAYIKQRMTQAQDRYYLLLDEVQQVKSWEKVVNSFLVDADVDIYITGSNAYLLSSELSTLLSGRSVEIKMLPLSFKEFLAFTDDGHPDSLEDTFNQYLKYGGLPTIVELREHEDTIGPFLEGITTPS
jgi:predicted AAA+ superfamily ATPase